MEKTRISDESIEFIKEILPAEALKAILPVTSENVYDLIDLLESGVEVPLAQKEEAGESVDHDVLERAVRAIDELNKDPDRIDYECLNQRLMNN